jgi:hypothetical protein
MIKNCISNIIQLKQNAAFDYNSFALHYILLTLQYVFTKTYHYKKPTAIFPEPDRCRRRQFARLLILFFLTCSAMALLLNYFPIGQQNIS